MFRVLVVILLLWGNRYENKSKYVKNVNKERESFFVFYLLFLKLSIFVSIDMWFKNLCLSKFKKLL